MLTFDHTSYNVIGNFLFFVLTNYIMFKVLELGEGTGSWEKLINQMPSLDKDKVGIEMNETEGCWVFTLTSNRGLFTKTYRDFKIPLF